MGFKKFTVAALFIALLIGACEKRPDGAPAQPSATIHYAPFVHPNAPDIPPVCNEDGWCWQNPLPQGLDLHDVWGTGPSDVFAVGDHGTILHYDGSHWSGMKSGTENKVARVWGFSPTDVYAVATGWPPGDDLGVEDRHITVCLHYDGLTWTSIKMSAYEISKTINRLWGTSSLSPLMFDTKIAFDRQSSYENWLYHWPPTRTALWGSSAKDVYAVLKERISHYDGRQWTEFKFAPESELKSVWGASKTDVYVAGETGERNMRGGTILHFNGRTWETAFHLRGADFSKVWGTSAKNVFVLGAANVSNNKRQAVVLRYDGVQWLELDNAPKEDIQAMWGHSPTDLIAVGKEGAIYRFDGATWTPMWRKITKADLTGIWGNSASDIYALGSVDVSASNHGDIVHYDGRTWALAFADNRFFLTLWGASGDEVFVGGGRNWAKKVRGGEIAHRYGEITAGAGESWHTVQTGIDFPVYGIWAGSKSDVIAVGVGGALQYDGRRWWPMKGAEGRNLFAVWGSSRHDAFAIWRDANDSSILHYDGSSWSQTAGLPNSRPWQPHKNDSQVRTLADIELTSIWGSSRADVFAAGRGRHESIPRDGFVLHYDGEIWSIVKEGEAIRPLGIYGFGAEVFVVGGGGEILHYDGKSWTEMKSPVVTINRLWGTSPTNFWVVGVNGAILHYGGSPPKTN
jgi:hypothetical protein